ncbi:hypothetical protein BT67DRAFT_125161 [Trichocladium antarcticum]|uniref:Secreted protein n=1 Tax=Trichocladium antarcticum TaxID=1450529 RepID=A0AAN6USA4_9PEZI|nr:hypothetical protein BT67DRAFT_125161 [Trichocladium antarcticum]
MAGFGLGVGSRWCCVCCVCVCVCCVCVCVYLNGRKGLVGDGVFILVSIYPGKASTAGRLAHGVKARKTELAVSVGRSQNAALSHVDTKDKAGSRPPDSLAPCSPSPQVIIANHHTVMDKRTLHCSIVLMAVIGCGWVPVNRLTCQSKLKDGKTHRQSMYRWKSVLE